MSGFEFRETVTLTVPDVKQNYAAFKESGHRDVNKLIVEVAAIHAGLTSNFNMYTPEALTESLSTWVNPYPRPIILNHDQMSESIGRVMASKMMKESDGTDYIRLQVAITDPLAIEKVLDERYLTGSVGGAAKSARCSVCNTDWVEAMEKGLKTAPCRHRRGSVYEGKLSYLELGGLGFKEYSFVNVPADQTSGVRAKAGITSEGPADESEWTHTVKMYSLSMNTPSVLEMSESAGHNLLEDMRKKEAQSTYMNLKGTFLTVSAYDYKENETEISNSSELEDTNNNDHVAKNNMSSSSQSDETILKEKKMAETAVDTIETDEDDILAVSEQLATDLANVESDEGSETDDAEAPTEEEGDDGKEEEESKEEESEETEALSENSDVEADTVSEEGASEEAEETAADDELVESEETKESEDVETAEEAEVTSEEGKPEGQENGNTDGTENPTREAALEIENKKLKEALRHMLVERVVDTKIAHGLGTDRAAMIEEHSTRTAASLSDSLKDLAHMPVKAKTEESVETPKVNETTLVADEKNVASDTDVAVTESKKEESPMDRAERYFFERMNGNAVHNQYTI